MNRFYYSNIVSEFISSSSDEILGIFSRNSQFDVDFTQKNAWLAEISILKDLLIDFEGSIYFEFSIPRMGRRIDVVLIIKNVIFILEFKMGESFFSLSAVDQVWDYALDLKNFHETSHNCLIAPVLICSDASDAEIIIDTTHHNDNLLFPIKSNVKQLKQVIECVLSFADGENINSEEWSKGRYSPTPTIIEAAISLYNNHSVANISRNDAEAINLNKTSYTVTEIINNSKSKGEKAICFITGVPGAGKTLVGLNIATKQLSEENGNKSVFLSGNGPLVSIL